MSHAKSLAALCLACVAMTADALTITDVIYDPQSKFLQVMASGGTPGERWRPYSLRPDWGFGWREVQSDGSYLFSKTVTANSKTPCRMVLRNEQGEDTAEYPVVIDYSLGNPIHFRCLPHTTQQVIRGHELGWLGVRWLIRPPEWCRWNPSPDRDLIWPRWQGDTCRAADREQELIAAINDSEAAALANGADPNWIEPNSRIIVMEMTTAGLNGTGGALSSAGKSGYIILSTQSRDAGNLEGYCFLAHEWQHANYQYVVFPGLTGDQWGVGVWPEALAFLGMKDVPACSNISDWHRPWPTRYVGGYVTAGPKEKRQLGLFYAYLRDRYNINWYEWVLDQHAALTAGDEISALRAAIGGWPDELDQAFTRFVDHYNQRDSTALPGIETLGPPSHFPALPSPHSGIPAAGHGMIEGDTRSFTVPTSVFSLSKTIEPSLRCPQNLHCAVVRRPDGTQWHWVDCVGSGDYYASGTSIYHPGEYTVTVASLTANTHVREMVFSMCAQPPCVLSSGPWPSPHTDDPWVDVTGCP